MKNKNIVVNIKEQATICCCCKRLFVTVRDYSDFSQSAICVVNNG